jgi:hypothetical protein
MRVSDRDMPNAPTKARDATEIMPRAVLTKDGYIEVINGTWYALERVGYVSNTSPPYVKVDPALDIRALRTFFTGSRYPVAPGTYPGTVVTGKHRAEAYKRNPKIMERWQRANRARRFHLRRGQFVASKPGFYNVMLPEWVTDEVLREIVQTFVDTKALDAMLPIVSILQDVLTTDGLITPTSPSQNVEREGDWQMREDVIDILARIGWKAGVHGLFMYAATGELPIVDIIKEVAGEELEQFIRTHPHIAAAWPMLDDIVEQAGDIPASLIPGLGGAYQMVLNAFRFREASGLDGEAILNYLETKAKSAESEDDDDD